jgi:hypothetical protein
VEAKARRDEPDAGSTPGAAGRTPVSPELGGPERVPGGTSSQSGFGSKPGAIPARRTAALVLAALGILALVLAGVRWGAERRRASGGAGEEAALSGSPTRAYTLYFVSNGQLVAERRDVVAKPSSSAQLIAVLTEMLAGSLTGNDPAVPAGTALRHLFLGENGLVTLDLSREVQRNQVGSMEGEYATLAALVRSVKDNFPEIHAVQILIDGKPEPTLAGHFSIADPLVCAEWLPASDAPAGGDRR